MRRRGREEVEGKMGRYFTEKNYGFKLSSEKKIYNIT